MSQGDSGDADCGWWSGWIQTAKEKSSSVIDVVKRDLTEFTCTMQHDGNKVASSVKEKLTQENASAATQKVKDGVTSFLGGISKALVIAPDDDYQLAQIVGGQAVVFDRYKARLHAIQTDPTSYTTEPSPADSYCEWLSGFDVETFKGSISELLVSNVEVRALYTQLVPLTVSNLDFWSRYYFRCRQLDEEEARRVELMRRADEVQGEKEMGWDEDDDDEWTEVSASQLQQQVDTPVGDTADTLPADTLPPYTQEVMTAAQHGRDAVTSSLDSHTPSLEMSSGPAAVTSISSSSSACIDAHDSQHVTPAAVPAPAEVCSDVTEAPADSMVNPAASTDHDSVGSSLSSDNTKSDSLVVVAVTPERTSPSEESSNAKESLDEEWEKDFDVEVTEQELQAAKERLKNAAASSPVTRDDVDAGKGGEDWEDW